MDLKLVHACTHAGPVLLFMQDACVHEGGSA